MAGQACLRMGVKGVPYRDCFCLMFGDQKVGHQKPQANSSLPVFPSVSLCPSSVTHSDLQACRPLVF